MNVIDCLKKGSRNAVSRTELSIMTGMSDRMVRREIGEYRDKGIMILNNGEGYFLYSGKKDDSYKNAYFATEEARAKTIRNRLRKMRKNNA